MMVSRINPAFPVFGNPTTQSVRDNFQFAEEEITELQARTGLAEVPAIPAGVEWVREFGNWVQLSSIDGGVF